MRRVSSLWLLVALAGCGAAGPTDTDGGQPPAPLPAATPGYRLAYGTFFGGTEEEEAREVLPYPDGSLLVGLKTNSRGLPTTPGAIQPGYAGDDPARGHPGEHGGDCFIFRLAPDGRQLLAATYFGGSRQERNTYGLGVASNGDVVLTSMTRSADLPTTPGAFQVRRNGAGTSSFVARLAGDATRLVWSTFVGGSGDDSPRGGLALGPDDSVYLVGATRSNDFPTTPDALQRIRRGTGDATIVRLSSDGRELLYGSLLGGTGTDMVIGARVEPAGALVLVGHSESADLPVAANATPLPHAGGNDLFVSRLSPDGRLLLSSVLVGGHRNEFAEHGIALGDDRIVVTGFTASRDFPVAGGAFSTPYAGKADGFVVALTRRGDRVLWSSRIGGSGLDYWLAPTLGDDGRVFVVGSTGSRDLPVTVNALQREYGGGETDGALLVLSADGTRLLYASYIGGGGTDVVRGLHVGEDGAVHLVGKTDSADFPVTDNAFQSRPGGKTDAFLLSLAPVATE